MKLSQRAFPHPVVGNADDVLEAAFQSPITVSHDGVNYYLSVDVQCSSPTISALIEKGDAAYIVHVECSNTLYRSVFEFTETKKELMIPGENLNATVEVNVFVRAKQDISGYTVENSHSDYGDTAFNISTGDVLAIAEGMTFDADIDFDALRSVSSIMQIRQHPADGDMPMEVDFDDEKITILLSARDFENYKIVKTAKPLSATVAAALVLPALLEALRTLQGDHSEYENLRWSRCLKRRVEQVGLSLTSEPLTLAQKLLELPIRRALTNARMVLDEGVE
ncbi:MAG: hypothetical protein NTW96_02485 [Planctomycetia bacterium]|nr:hypothetical protein [Planctomycetia bacterium]